MHPADIAAFFQVVLIDLALAGDNAIAVGLAAAALPAAQQKRVIFWGVLGALMLRIGFALITVQLLQFKGLLLAGGLLLFWVAYRMWRDMQPHAPEESNATTVKAEPNFGRALLSIIIADVSMSLDNVLAVAGVSRHSPVIMAFGLVLSVVLMAVAAGLVANLIGRFRWIAFVGIAIILFAAAQMIWEDLAHFFPETVPPLPRLGVPAH